MSGISWSRSDFPEDFRFGTATSSYQIEGNAKGGCGPSHWDAFARDGGTLRGEDGSVACDHLNRWREDLDLVSQAGFDGYRFSVAWPRVQPAGSGQVNREGLDFYDALVDGLLARNVEPHLTLYHWDLPLPLAEKGGWTNRDTAKRFGDFTEIVMDRIGDRMASVATINEPWCVAWLSHFEGHHAPGLTDIGAAGKAMHNILLAHAHGLDAIRAHGDRPAGIVLNFEAALPARANDKSETAADLYDGIYNRWFLQALTTGTYPEAVLEGLESHLPQGWQDDMAKIARPIDWLGINYYTRSLVDRDDTLPWPHLKTSRGELERTATDWEIYPEGIHQFLTRIAEQTGDLPLHVTENGLATNERPDQSDDQRIRYLDQHGEQLLRAIADDVPLHSYFIWSLLDNFEWALGYDMRFGLTHVDFDTQARTPKASYGEVRDALSR
ncbi:GH1 family beta-glucosidase [Ahrensia sp. R2A130]|uniref:GH1 family beta-glucosidase n=1 Tax=Ahrensia sp. R2A130 TaxID=744979 RepID=UPI0001E0B521|nr:GH1 family beta-glucosidase [Ahrensia sp. R2A130]EFL87781.1 beta-galactosidase [Ahrensia sp. R2A130]